jgi:hypothetical protein
MHRDAVHGADLGFGATERDVPIRFVDAIQHAECDKRVQFVETLEGEYRDVHSNPRFR